MTLLLVLLVCIGWGITFSRLAQCHTITCTFVILEFLFTLENSKDLDTMKFVLGVLHLQQLDNILCLRIKKKLLWLAWRCYLYWHVGFCIKVWITDLAFHIKSYVCPYILSIWFSQTHQVMVPSCCHFSFLLTSPLLFLFI